MADWDLVGWVYASKVRLAALASLARSPKTPKLLGEDIGKPLPRVSAVLRDLGLRGLSRCLNPEGRKGRLYGITTKGTRILGLTQQVTPARSRRRLRGNRE